MYLFDFFFSSRRRHTRYWRDWSSDVCSSDLEGNGCAERFIRTLKENLLWVRSFDTVEELRVALLAFRETYNTAWLIERHGFRPPGAVRQDQLSTAALAA